MAAEDKLLAAAIALTRTSTAAEIDSLIERVAGASLGPLGECRVLETIKQRTRIPLSALATQLAAAKRDFLPAVAVPDWARQVTLLPSGEPCPIASNVLIALRHAPEWRGVLGFDEFHQRPVFLNKPPWANGHWPTDGQAVPLSDVDDSRALVWIQQAGIHCRIDAVRQAMSIAIDDNRFHPIRDYLDGLQWDDVPRIDTWLSYYLGVEPIENYTGPVGSRWLISGVARIYNPGCMAKYCLVLEGPQDLQKSTALEALGTPWFTDDVSELGTKDSQMQVGNAWIVELAELDSVRKAHVSSIKAFISRKTDKFRKPFGRYIIDQPRQCILAGTVNPSGEYLTDDTGNVRFWPVRCGAIDIEALRHDRDQLWAEAVARYRAGEHWWLDAGDAVVAAHDQQELRFAADSWQDQITRWLYLNPAITEVTISEILSSVFDLPPKDHDKPSQTRVGLILRRLKWSKPQRVTRQDGERARVYERPRR